MRVLITGHRGYIGQVLMPMIAAHGHSVVGLDCGLFADCGVGPAPNRGQWIDCDLRDVVAEDLQGFDAVMHLAALCNDPLGNLNPALTFAINYEASLRFAQLSKDAGVDRFISSSSCSIYGTAGEEFVTEQSSLKPVTIYGETKVLLDEALASMADERFCPVFLRNATAYGASPSLRLDIVLNEMVADALTDGSILIRSDGTPWRPIVHVRDISLAFLCALEAPRSAVFNQAFNVGRNSENYQVRDLAAIVRRVVPGSDIEYAPNGGPDKRCYRVDCNKISKVLPGFKPEWDAERGAKELRDYYTANGLRREDVVGIRYRRVHQIKEMIASEIIDSNLRFINKSGNRRTAAVGAVQ